MITANTVVASLVAQPSLTLRPLRLNIDGLNEQKKSEILKTQLQDPGLFLEKYGKDLPYEQFEYFQEFKDNYEVKFYLKKLGHFDEPKPEVMEDEGEAIYRGPRRHAEGGLTVQAKNRRFRFMKRLSEDSNFFNEESMSSRQPEIYHQFIGQYKPRPSPPSAAAGSQIAACCPIPHKLPPFQPQKYQRPPVAIKTPTPTPTPTPESKIDLNSIPKKKKASKKAQKSQPGIRAKRRLKDAKVVEHPQPPSYLFGAISNGPEVESITVGGRLNEAKDSKAPSAAIAVAGVLERQEVVDSAGESQADIKTVPSSEAVSEPLPKSDGKSEPVGEVFKLSDLLLKYHDQQEADKRTSAEQAHFVPHGLEQDSKKKKQNKPRRKADDLTGSDESEIDSDDEQALHKRQKQLVLTKHVTFKDNDNEGADDIDLDLDNEDQPDSGFQSQQPVPVISAERRLELREEFIKIMQERFLLGYEDAHFDYNEIDNNPDLDDLELVERDAQEKYFDNDDDNENVVKDSSEESNI